MAQSFGIIVFLSAGRGLFRFFTGPLFLGAVGVVISHFGMLADGSGNSLFSNLSK